MRREHPTCYPGKLGLIGRQDVNFLQQFLTDQLLCPTTVHHHPHASVGCNLRDRERPYDGLSSPKVPTLSQILVITEDHQLSVSTESIIR
jgi:hypothetical protein